MMLEHLVGMRGIGSVLKVNNACVTVIRGEGEHGVVVGITADLSGQRRRIDDLGQLTQFAQNTVTLASFSNCIRGDCNLGVAIGCRSPGSVPPERTGGMMHVSPELHTLIP